MNLGAQVIVNTAELIEAIAKKDGLRDTPLKKNAGFRDSS